MANFPPEKPAVLQIGISEPRADALDKVTGRVRYAADQYPPGLLWAGVKRAGIPHAEILEVDASRAAALPGVAAVFTAADVPGSNRQGVVQRDQPVLADDWVRHAGDGLALVVAESREILARALALVELRLNPLPAVLDPLLALEPGAPLVHPNRKEGNLLLEGRVVTGRGAEALEHCPVVVEAEIDLPRQEHAYLETENGWAVLRENGVLEITVSTQTPFRDRSEVAEALGLDPAKLRIIAPPPGGAFGGKDGITVQSLLALAALKLPGRPVKMVWDREESFLAGAKRHPARVRTRLGADESGRLLALTAEAVFDTGPYDHLGGVVAALALEHLAGPYRVPEVRLRSRAVYTNNPVSGAFRGFGVPQALAGVEQAMDLLADRLGLCPLELRRRNALRAGDMNPVGVTLTGSCGLEGCLEALAQSPLWREREAWASSAPSHTLRGVGLAAAHHGLGYGPVIPDTAGAKVELGEDGRFLIYSGVVDMGQGNASTALQLAGQILCQGPDNLVAVLPDTARTLPSGSASASRTTFTYAPALIRAARDLAARLLAKAGGFFLAPASEMTLAPGVIRHRPSGREIPLARLGSLLERDERVAVAYHQAPTTPERPSPDPALALQGLPHKVFSYTAHLARVEVCTITGRVKVADYLMATDCGRLMNPQCFHQQMEGGAAQGLGWALFEEMPAPGGMIATPDLATYLLPTSLDLPDMASRAVETWEPDGPLGLKGAGEISIDPPLAAVANALARALGSRLPQAPFTPERILLALWDDPAAGDANGDHAD